MATIYETKRSAPVVHDDSPVSDGWLPAGLHDVHMEPVGNFAGRVYPEDPVGSFGNIRHLRCEGTGTFRGDADHQREGSFADRAPIEHFTHAA